MPFNQFFRMEGLQQLDFKCFTSFLTDPRVDFISTAVPGISFGTAVALVKQQHSEAIADLLNM